MYAISSTEFYRILSVRNKYGKRITVTRFLKLGQCVSCVESIDSVRFAFNVSRAVVLLMEG